MLISLFQVNKHRGHLSLDDTGVIDSLLIDVGAVYSIQGVNIMTNPMGVEQVGDQDPEMQNSPIADENDDLEYDLHENVSGTASCFFNDKSYPDGSFVRSGSTLLRCDRGVWVVAGGSDPDNP
jgi:hypothetical protein